MKIIADLQLHSKYSRAVSKDMTIPGILAWAKRKGIGLIATGDWTHPLWFKEIQENLEEVGNGFLKLKKLSVVGDELLEKETHNPQLITNNNPLFLLATEVSCIYSQGGKGRRIHTLIWVPSLISAENINKEMTKQGCNLLSDGRPIIGLSNIQVAELVFTIEPKALIIPAHIWTPYFGTYGSMSGFNSIEEAFGSFADRIYAVETGLSSNPAMNWQIKELDHRSIVSFSDAHSGPKLGREATVFEFEGTSIADFSYDILYEAIREPWRKNQEISLTLDSLTSDSSATRDSLTFDSAKIAYTIEFYPDEGKYHFSGHRSCKIRWGPTETREKGTICPVCGKPLTQGVVQRVAELAERTEEELKLESRVMGQESGVNVKMIRSKLFPDRPPFAMLVPLQEIIAECLGSSVTSKKVIAVYQTLIDTFGGEFPVLLHVSKEDIVRVAGDRIGAGIEKVRTGDIIIDPGYDGIFGVVKLWRDDEEKPLIDATREQLRMF